MGRVMVKIDKWGRVRIRRRFLKIFLKTNYNSQLARVNRLGRIQIPALLRRKIKMEGEIAIEERRDNLELKPM